MQHALNSFAKALSSAPIFFTLYVLLVIPTYLLPYAGSNSTLVNALGAAAGIGLSPQFWLHIACLFTLLVLAWLRGCAIGKQWIAVFPAIAGVFDMTPGLSVVPLVPTVMHIVLLVVAVRGSSAGPVDVHVSAPGVALSTIGAALIGAGLAYSLAWPARMGTQQQASQRIEAARPVAGVQVKPPKSQQAAGVQSNSSGAKLIGQWYDGGPGCASLRKGSNERIYVLRAWYCEADEMAAKPLYVSLDDTLGAYVEEASGLSLRVRGDGKLEVSAKGEIRQRVGDGSYLADEVTVFGRK